MNEQVAAAAAAVVAEWLVSGRSPREPSPLLRDAPAPLRAAVARAVAAALTWRARTEFAFGDDRRLRAMEPLERARLLVQVAGGPTDVRIDARIDSLGDPRQRFAARHSLPDWFVALAAAQFGEQAHAVAAALALPAPRAVRANLLRVPSREELAQELLAEGIATQPARFAATALHVLGDADLFATHAFRRGAFEQQDEASQLVALVVAPPPGGKVLDLCAGSGGKSLAIAAALQNRGVVFATDVHEGRLAALRERLARAGAHNVRVETSAERELAPAVAAFAGHADRVLVDAPCTGCGSWRRRPEGRWAGSTATLDALVRTQDALLLRAAAVLRPGARLIYATCSLLDVENEQRVRALLAVRPELEVVRVAEILGGDVARPIADGSGTFLSLRPDTHGCDGFFAAVLRAPRPSPGLATQRS